MTNETMPADWAIAKALTKLTGISAWSVEEVKRRCGEAAPSYILDFARYIEAHEEPPVDRKLLCAREAAVFVCGEHHRQEIESGEWDKSEEVITPQRAITLWEEGFGK